MVSSIYQLLKDAGWYPNESKEIVFNSLVPAFSIEDLNNFKSQSQILCKRKKVQ